MAQRGRPRKNPLPEASAEQKVESELNEIKAEKPPAAPTVETKPEDAAVASPSPEPPTEVPQHLIEQARAAQEVVERLMRQIEDFKSGEAYLEGDIPVTLPSMKGPGFNPSDRKLNWIAEKHLDSRLAFRWGHKSMVDYHRARGRWAVVKKDFDKMTMARGGTYAFSTSPEGFVVCGDLVLMATTREQNERLKQAVRDKTRRGEARARSPLYNQGEKLGVEVTEGDMGGPKAQRILAYLEKELGPDVRRVFLGK